MALKKYKPVTPGQRFKEISAFDDITTDKPEKSLLVRKLRTGGRNHKGKMTMRYIGGGHKQKYRIIDFKRDKENISGTIKSVEYDPNRSARIALVYYADGEKRYIIAPQGVEVGQKIDSGKGVSADIGNCMYLSEVPFGTVVHNIELRPGQGGKLSRSAGSYGQLMSRDGKYAILRMPSGETRMILQECKATVGMVSNPDHSLGSLRKGRSFTLA
jgi:large subunit ribosomal protein L2